jgi:branched-subunit amino acid transport protein
MDVPVLIAGMAVLTYLTRALPLLLGSRAERLPPSALRWLRYLPPALFAAVAVPAILAPTLAQPLAPVHPYPWAALTAGVLARLTRNLPLAMVASMLVVLGWRLVLG